MTTTLGLPLFLEDKTGLITGPTEFIDIYDRPPFVQVDTTFVAATRRILMSISANDGRRRTSKDSVKITLEPSLEGTVRIKRAGEMELRKWLRRPQNGA